VEWSRVATTTYASHLGCDQAMHEEAYPKKKHIKRTLKKYVLVQLHHGIHWTSSPLMLSSNFNSSLICQLGLVVVLP
jgi:hypothetical protein